MKPPGKIDDDEALHDLDCALRYGPIVQEGFGFSVGLLSGMDLLILAGFVMDDHEVWKRGCEMMKATGGSFPSTEKILETFSSDELRSLNARVRAASGIYQP